MKLGGHGVENDGDRLLGSHCGREKERREGDCRDGKAEE